MFLFVYWGWTLLLDVVIAIKGAALDLAPGILLYRFIDTGGSKEFESPLFEDSDPVDRIVSKEVKLKET